MQIKYQPAAYNRSTAILTLEDPQELALTDDDLMRIVENGQGVVFDHRDGKYHLNGESFGPDNRFGGSVETLPTQAKLVSVLID